MHGVKKGAFTAGPCFHWNSQEAAAVGQLTEQGWWSAGYGLAARTLRMHRYIGRDAHWSAAVVRQQVNPGARVGRVRSHVHVTQPLMVALPLLYN